MILASWLLTGLLLTSSLVVGSDFPSLRYGPGTTVVDGPRMPSGLPDYRRAIVNRVSDGVSPEENAWCGISETFNQSRLEPGYLESLKKVAGFELAGRLPLGAWPEDDDTLRPVREELEVANGGAWKSEECPRVARWLESNRGPLDHACRAVSRPKAYAPIVVPDETPVCFSVLGHIPPVRELASALAARANQSIGLGRFDDAWSDVLAGHRLARHLARGHSVIEVLAGWSVVAVMNAATVEAIVSTPGGPAAVADRWQELEPLLLSNVRLADQIEVERLMVLDIILRCRASRDATDTLFFEDPPLRSDRGLLRLPAQYGEWLWRFLRWKAFCCMDVNEHLELANQYFDEAISVFDREGIRARARAFRAIESKYLEAPKLPTRYTGVRNLVADIVGSLRLMPIIGLLRKHALPFESLDEGVRRNSQKNRLFLAAVLAEMHYRETGRDIEAGAELVSVQKKYQLDSEALKPTDLFHKKPLRIRRDAEALLIYSVGPNGRDDEGRPWDVEMGDDDFAVRLPRRRRG